MYGVSQRSDNAILSNDTSSVSPHENPGVKHTKATMAKQGSACPFEVLFIGRLSTGGGEKKKRSP